MADKLGRVRQTVSQDTLRRFAMCSPDDYANSLARARTALNLHRQPTLSSLSVFFAAQFLLDDAQALMTAFRARWFDSLAPADRQATQLDAPRFVGAMFYATCRAAGGVCFRFTALIES